jgi:hypothetical protein
VKAVVEAHHGWVWVESPGCNEARCPGSTFYIVIPVSQARWEKVTKAKAVVELN